MSPHLHRYFGDPFDADLYGGIRCFDCGAPALPRHHFELFWANVAIVALCQALHSWCEVGLRDLVKARGWPELW